MNKIMVKDGTEIYYKDWGSGQPIVFSHGWPLNADAFEDQMFYLVHEATVALHMTDEGMAAQVNLGMEMTWILMLMTSPSLSKSFSLKDAILVGHSTGGGEVVRYIGRHGTKRVSKVVLIGAVPPLMLKTPDNPGGLPIEVFDQLRARRHN